MDGKANFRKGEAGLQSNDPNSNGGGGAHWRKLRNFSLQTRLTGVGTFAKQDNEETKWKSETGGGGGLVVPELRGRRKKEDLEVQSRTAAGKAQTRTQGGRWRIES